MADNSGGAEGGHKVPMDFNITGSVGYGREFGLNPGPNPIPPIDPMHGESERWMVRNAFPINNGEDAYFGSDSIEGDDMPNVPSPNAQIGVPQDISPPAPKMPIAHGHDSLTEEEVGLT